MQNNILKYKKPLSLWRQRTADRAARAAGTVYRVAAGTESLDIINDSTGTHPSTKSAGADNSKQKKSVSISQQQRLLDGDVDTDNDNDATSRILTTNHGLSQNGVINFPYTTIL